MIVEIDINVKCPECGSVMVRHRNPDYVSCGFSECENNGRRWESPKIVIHEIIQESKQDAKREPCPACGALEDEEHLITCWLDARTKTNN
jgi:ribosomal protein S27AE